MPFELKIKGREIWYTPCSFPIKVYRNNAWHLLTSNDRFFYNGEWRGLCGDIVIGNTIRAQEFQKSCPAGESGSRVTYTIPADTYFASTLVAANALADNDIASNGQAYANSLGYCLVNSVYSILVVDMYNDSTLDVCAYIDTVGVAESNNIVARNGLNYYQLTDDAASAYMLSSDDIPLTTALARRFEFNIGKLLSQYPAINVFTFKIRGRANTSGLQTGVYALKNPNQKMIMSGTTGNHVPSVTPSGGPTPSSWTSNVTGGGNGSIGLSIGNVILTFTYNRTTNIISVTTV